MIISSPSSRRRLRKTSIAPRFAWTLLATGLGFAAPILETNAAVSGTFRQFDLQAGGYVTGVAVKPYGTGVMLYARTDVGGVYQSLDAGKNWTIRSSQFTSPSGYDCQGIAIGYNAWTVFQATGTKFDAAGPERGVWKSVDGGANWTHVLKNVQFEGNDIRGRGGECIVVKPDGANPETVVVASSQTGIWRSTQGGTANSWVQLAAFPNDKFSSVVIPSMRQNEIWAGSEKGLYVSNDANNTTWTFVPILGNGVPYYVWRITVLDSGRILVALRNSASEERLYEISSTNWAGKVYSYRDLAAPGSASISITVLEELNGGPDSGKLLIKRRNQASAWLGTLTQSNTWVWSSAMPVGADAPSDAHVWPLAVRPGTTGINPLSQIVQDPTKPTRFFATWGYGMLVSDQPADTLTSTAMAKFRFSYNGIGELCGYAPAFDTLNAGRTGDVYFPVLDQGVVSVVNSGTTTTPNGVLIGDFSDPESWTYARRVLVGTGNNVLAFGGLGKDSAPESNGARIWKTTDRGVTWTRYRPAPDDNVAGLKLAGGGRVTGPIIDAVSTSSSFTSDNLSSFMLAIRGGTDKADVGSGGIYYTTDGGETFTQAFYTPPGGSPQVLPKKDAVMGDKYTYYTQLERDSSNERIVYTKTRYAAFFRTTGATDKAVGSEWVKLAHPGVPGSWEGDEFRFCVDSNRNSGGVGVARIWAANPNAAGLKYSDNRGQSWSSSIGGFTYAVSVSARDGIVCVLGRRAGDTFNKIYLSTDQGSTWDVVTRTGNLIGLADFVTLSPHVTGQIWVATGGRSYAVFTPSTTIIKPIP